MASLSELTNEFPDTDASSYLKMLLTETDDRGGAIMGSAFIEQCLEVAIRSRIADPGKDIANSWFKGPNAPFSSFSSKIQLGRALAIYGPQMQDQLIAIKDIRNVFAHRALPLDFNHPSLLSAVHKVAPFMRGSKSDKFRSAFVSGCFVIGSSLIEDAYKHGDKELTVTFP